MDQLDKKVHMMIETIHHLIVSNWLVQVVAIAIGTAAIMWLYSKIHFFVYKKLQVSKRVWDDIISHALYKPLQFLIFMHGLLLILYLGVLNLRATEVGMVLALQKVILLLSLLWFGQRCIAFLEDRLTLRSLSDTESKLDQTTVRGVCQFSRILVLIIVVLFALESFGIGLSGVLAFSGLSSIAIGFAAKDLLANFFGGFMIFHDRPFSVGDWIASPDRQIEGTVEYIGWRLTRIRTFDKRPLYVPNSIFSTIAIINPQRMTNRRIKTIIGLRYQDRDKLPLVTEGIEKLLRGHPEIDQKTTTFVKLVNFGPSSLDILLYTFTKTTNWVRFQNIQQEIFLEILSIIDHHGAACAFPTTTVDMAERLDVKALVNIKEKKMTGGDRS